MLLRGDRAEVVLVAGDQRHPTPGSVPVGTYDVEATFPGGAPAVAGQVEVTAGGTVTLVCNQIFELCKVE